MKRTGSPRSTAALLPLVAVPIAVIAATDVFDGLPDFVRGLLDGVSIALLLGFCLLAGSRLGVAKRRADVAKLDTLDPLGGLPRDGGEDR